MRKIKFLFAVTFNLFLAFNLFSQAIYTSPEKATDDVAVDVIVNIAECSRQDLLNTAEDVYIHIGVNIDKFAGQWSYVQSDWGVADQDFKMTKVSTNVYKFSISPSARDYFGVKANERIYSIAVVVRNGNGSKQTEDLFAAVYEGGLNVEILTPSQDTIVKKGDDITVSAISFPLGSGILNADSLKLYLGDSLLHKVEATSITHTFQINKVGSFWLKAEALNNDTLVKDSVSIYFHNVVTIEDVPAGLEDGINYIDDNTATLVLFAPYKSLIFAIGDFNNWELQNEYQLKKSTDGKRWWITLNGLTKGEEYAFQYLIDGNLRVADPYTEKVLDPWNDRYIPSSTYPDLKAYPKDKTEGIVSIIQTGVTPYEWQTTDFQAPAVENLVIYEMHVQNFTEAGNIKTVTDTLDYLERLGINAIELMPVNEFEGNQSWGYNPSYYFAFDKIYGTKADFKEFVDACHARGIAVIIDLVLNHSFSQSPLVQMYWDGSNVTSLNPWYNTSCPHSMWCWGYDFDHESPATEYFVDRVNNYWLTEYNVDGYRFDFTKGFTNTVDAWANGPDASRINILKRMSDEIWKVKESAYVIFEHLADNSEETQLSDYGIMLWGNMNYQYNEATMGYNTGDKSDFSGISYKTRSWSDPHLVGYMESHDEERLMYKNLAYGNSNSEPWYTVNTLHTALDRVGMAGAFFFTVPGPKMIWEFGELGFDYSINRCEDGSISEDCRLSPKPIRWDYYDHYARYRLFKVFELLIDLKTGHEITKTNDFELNVRGEIKTIHLNGTDMNAVVVGNFGVTNGEVIPNFQSTGTWYSYLTGESIEVTDVSAPISLDAGEYHVYTDKFIPVEEYPSGNNEIISNEPFGEFEIYPNPYTNGNELKLNYLLHSEDFTNFYIYNQLGQMVYQQKLSLSGSGIEELNLPSMKLKEGIYIYKITTSKQEYTGKLVVE